MSEKEKIPVEEVKKIPRKLLERLIDEMRDHLKEDETVQRMFKEYKVDIDQIYLIPMAFSDLDVSAKTDHGIIYYNYKLLCDGDFKEDFQYGVHEITHWLQQTTGTKPTQSADDGSYLDNPYEKEGFKNQLEWAAKEMGEDHVDEYVDDLLEHHGIEDKKEVKEKKKELLSQV